MATRQELGLRTHPIDDTLCATGRSYQRLGLLAPPPGARPASKM
jgi:hypothetical protein